jgi:hypothetical protein
VAGTLAGFFLAYWWSRTLADFTLGQFFNAPAQLNLSPDMRVLLSTATVAILTGVLFGLAPAWRATREDPNFALQKNAQKFSRSTGTLGKSLIVTQVALSLVLLAAAGLFLRTLDKLRTIQPGYQPQGVLDASLYPKPGGYKNFDRVNYYQELTARVSRLPGVESAGIAKMSLGWRAWKEDVRTGEATDAGARVDFALVMPGFFHTVGIYPQKGRIFTWRDDDSAPRVAIVSQSLAKKLFAGREAIGQRLEITTEPAWQKVEIVGVVSDASLYDIREHGSPSVYVPSTQYGEIMGWSQLMLRTKAAPAAMANAVRQTVDSLGHEYVAKTHMVVDHRSFHFAGTAICDSFGFFRRAGIAAGWHWSLWVDGLQRHRAHSGNRRARRIGSGPKRCALDDFARDAWTNEHWHRPGPCVHAGGFAARRQHALRSFRARSCDSGGCLRRAHWRGRSRGLDSRAARVDPMVALRYE